MLDSLVGESQHLIVSISQECFSLGVLLSLGGVDLSVKFDSEATIWTTEIDHEGADRMLAVELQTTETAITERLPEQCLRRSLLHA